MTTIDQLRATVFPHIKRVIGSRMPTNFASQIQAPFSSCEHFALVQKANSCCALLMTSRSARRRSSRSNHPHIGLRFSQMVQRMFSSRQRSVPVAEAARLVSEDDVPVFGDEASKQAAPVDACYTCSHVQSTTALELEHHADQNEDVVGARSASLSSSVVSDAPLNFACTRVVQQSVTCFALRGYVPLTSVFRLESSHP